MIDLHMHTKYSDGTDDIIEILKKAEKYKLSYISITDHNTCKEYEELEKINIRKFYSGNIIKGVELNTKVSGIPIEILGYGMDAKKLQKLIDEIYISNEERLVIELKRLVDKCKENGIILPNNFIENYNSSIYPSKYLHTIIVQDVKNKSIIDDISWKDSNIFYRRYMSNPKTIFYVNMDDIIPDFDKACQIIKESGGLVFIPHIYEYGENSEKILNWILKQNMIHGIECYYRNFTENQTKYLLKICKEYNLYSSGGSDYHGKNKKNVDMGIGEGNLNVPEEIVEKWGKSLTI